jgi:PKD repeat protein
LNEVPLPVPENPRGAAFATALLYFAPTFVAFMKRIFVIFPLVLALLQVACKKDDLRGWTFYQEPPPPLTIVSTGYTVKNCIPPFPVTFRQETQNKLGTVRYFWDFGDGSSSTDQFPNHTYALPGTYKVKYRVSNEISADSLEFNLTELQQASIPVQADFLYSHTNNNSFAPTKVLFTNASRGGNLFYWYFGDGQENANESPEHVFSAAGTYNVRLRATCSSGATNETVRQVFVQPAPRRVVLDSITLMLPSGFRNVPVFIEFYHNTTPIGRTRTISPSSYPFKFRRPGDFPGGYIFDFVQFSGNEAFKFIIWRDNGANPPTPINEVLLATSFIQNRYYPRKYPQVEPIPAVTDLFLDLYLDY